MKPQPYGEAWVQGDVIGCAIDLDEGTISFYRNGHSLGVAFDRVRTMQPTLAYFPSVSLSHTERCSLNFGAKPFAYPIPGFQPLQAPPPAADTQAAEYCCGCLARLALAAAERPEPEGPEAAAPTAADKQVSLMDDLEGSSGPPASSAATAAAAAGLAPGATAFNGCGLAAAGWMPPFAGPPLVIASADMLLLSTVVLGPLQKLLVMQPYLVQAVLLPLLMELQHLSGDGPPHQLLLLLQLMHVVWGDSARDVVFAVLEELAFRCAGPLALRLYTGLYWRTCSCAFSGASVKGLCVLVLRVCFLSCVFAQ